MEITAESTYTLTMDNQEARLLYASIKDVFYIINTNKTFFNDFINNSGLDKLVALKYTLEDILEP